MYELITSQILDSVHVTGHEATDVNHITHHDAGVIATTMDAAPGVVASYDVGNVITITDIFGNTFEYGSGENLYGLGMA